MQYLEKVLRLTAGVGEELLGCGAEISRVEETMNRIASHYDISRQQIYIIANGVFVNLEYEGETQATSIQYVPQIEVDLSKLCELNNLSREIEKNNPDIDEALRRLETIRQEKKKCVKKDILASGIGAGAFCFLFGGDLKDSLGAFFMGVLVWTFFSVFSSTSLSKVLRHIAGSLLVTAGCILFFRLGFVNHLDKAIIGSLIPMIPGVAFVNGVRDLADGDYISGAIRLLDATLIFICIAAGVYLALHLGEV